MSEHSAWCAIEPAFQWIYGIGMERIATMTPRRFAEHYDAKDKIMKLQTAR